MIKQHEGELTFEKVEGMQGTGLLPESSKGNDLSNYYNSERFPDFNGIWSVNNKQGKTFRIFGGEIVQSFGKPNCHIEDYECPDVWLFYDPEYNVRWLVFSDGLNRNHKGTSYIVKIPDSFTKTDFEKAIHKFFKHFGFNNES